MSKLYFKKIIFELYYCKKLIKEQRYMSVKVITKVHNKR